MTAKDRTQAITALVHPVSSVKLLEVHLQGKVTCEHGPDE